MRNIASIFIGVLIVLFSMLNAYAGTPISLYESLAGNLNYTGTGGTLRTDSNGGDACAVTNSDSASLSGIPTGATVVAAYLYWAGSYSTDGGSTQTAPDSDITFEGTDLSADRTFVETFNYFGIDYDFFSGFKDVTGLVTSNGTYTFSNLSVNSGDPHCVRAAVVAGWSLLVIYEETVDPRLRVINIFDGFEYHRGSSISVTPDNFVIPSDPSDIDGKMSHISWEGDVENSDPLNGYSEQLLFNGNALTDGLNPSNNQFNSTINLLGTSASYGVDFDTYDITGYLSPDDTSATSTFSSGGDLVLLSAEIISVTNTPVADLAASKTHTGNFVAGQEGVYTITVTNNGPSDTDAADTITLVETLPAGLAYVSSSEVGWSSPAFNGRDITWTYTGTALPAGSSLPPITLTVNPDASTIPSVTNTVTVSSTMFDNISDNNTADDPTTILETGLSGSTLTVSDLNGGDAEPGDILRYTVTLLDSSGSETTGVQATGDISAHTADFSVMAIPAGSTDGSLPPPGGANGAGYLDIADITVPAGGSVNILFDVTIEAGTLPGTTIDQSVIADVASSGTNFTIDAPTIIVSESQVSSSGNKPLYLYSSPNILSRTPPSVAQTEVTINGAGASDTWTMTPVSQGDIIIDGSSGSIPVVLWLDESGRDSERDVRVELRIGAMVIGSDSQTIDFDTPKECTFYIPVSGDIALSSGDAITLYIENETNRRNRRLVVSPTSGSDHSRVDMQSKTVINVDSIDFYDAAYPGGGVISLIKQEATIYVRSVISDPFGSFDIAGAALDVIDSEGIPVILGEPMTNVADSGADYSTWELGLDIAAADPTGLWTARVTTVEGTEGLVTHSISDDFRVVSNVTGVEFVDVNGNPVNGYPMDTGDATAYVRVVDDSANLDTGTIDSVSVTVSDPSTGDSENLTLYETGNNTGIFEGSGLTVSTSTGAGVNDGVLYVTGGYSIEVAYSGVSDTVYIPTLAVISSFQSVVEDGDVVVKWDTASEIGTIGFHLFRKESGDFIRLNDRLLPGLLVSGQGGSYRFVDETAVAGVTHTYKLVEKEVRGRKRVHGPYTVTAEEVISESSYAPVRRMSSFSKGSVYTDRRDRKFTRQSAGQTKLKIMRVKARKAAMGAVRRLLFPWQRSRAKISISDTGIYYITSGELAEAFGISSNIVEYLIRHKRLSLTTQGESVPWKQGEGNNGILFLGVAIDSVYTAENIYWLTVGLGSTMETTRNRLPEDALGDDHTATFTCDVHGEENRVALTGSFDDPYSDYWMWDYVTAGWPGMDSKVFNIRADGAAQVEGTAFLSINLQGVTDDVECDADHHVMVLINGIPAGEGYFDGTSAASIDVSFAQLLLDDGVNSIEIRSLADTGAAFSIFYINSFDLTYQRTYRASGNVLRFTGDGDEPVTISGFAGSDIMVFDITNPADPVAVRRIVPEGAEGDYYLNFKPADGKDYIALTSGGLKQPVSVTGCSRSWLKKRWNSADYIVIAPSELSAAAEFLCEYRKQQGLETMVVELSDIMDEFNHGIFNPEAITDFVSYAYHQWRKAPQYVVLAGDGSYDYKNFGGYDDNLIPPLMVRTADGLSASDGKFGDVEGRDGVPEVSIGRIPVLTSDELLFYIEKIKAYETSGGVTASSRVMMLADDPDGGGAFGVDSDGIAALLPEGFYADKIYLGPTFIDDARNMIIEGMKTGPAFVNYMGHGGLDRFAAEGMLTSEDVPVLEGSGGFPVVAAMTCVAGRFSFPGFDCISERLVIAEDGGAAAVWSPTGFSMNSDAGILNEEFITALFRQEEKTLGTAVLKACEAYRQRGCGTNLPLIYNLLGDPALNVR